MTHDVSMAREGTSVELGVKFLCECECELIKLHSGDGINDGLYVYSPFHTLERRWYDVLPVRCPRVSK